MPPRYLSKSKILEGLQCPKRLWLTTHRPELAEVSSGVEARLQAGLAVHDVYRTLYADGVLVEAEEGLSGAIEATQQLVRVGAARIFEATFSVNGVLVRNDLLEWVGDGYRLIEVKSSTSVKDYHLRDLAVQAWVVAGSGLTVDSAWLAHIDNSFVYSGNGDYRGLFFAEEVTGQITSLQADIPSLVESLRETLGGPEPGIAPSDQCYDPFECPYCAYCIPAESGPEFPVELLPGGSRLEKELLEEGCRDLREVPRERISSERQLMVWQAVTTGEPQVNPTLAEELRALDYPRYYLDFETISFAIPIWAGTRPYQQLPFQYSCHMETADGALSHREFLDISGEAPMRRLAEQMIADLGSCGPVVTYGHFERMIIGVLISLHPELEAPLAAVQERIVDLLPLLRANYYHPEMHGSWSIKAVLPTIAPELRYDMLGEVQDGSGAQEAYLEAIHPETTNERREELRGKMLRYCGQDSLAMVKVVNYFLRG